MTQYQPHMPKRIHSHGFTLVELMVTVAVMGIIAAMAAPSFSQQMARQRMKSSASSIESVLKQAKAESRIRNKNVTVSYSSGSSSVSAILAGESDPLEEQTLNARSDIQTTSTSLIITPSATTDATTFTICDKAVSGETGIQIQITTTAQITTSTTGGCS